MRSAARIACLRRHPRRAHASVPCEPHTERRDLRQAGPAQEVVLQLRGLVERAVTPTSRRGVRPGCVRLSFTTRTEGPHQGARGEANTNTNETTLGRPPPLTLAFNSLNERLSCRSTRSLATTRSCFGSRSTTSSTRSWTARARRPPGQCISTCFMPPCFEFRWMHRVTCRLKMGTWGGALACMQVRLHACLRRTGFAHAHGPQRLGLGQRPSHSRPKKKQLQESRLNKRTTQQRRPGPGGRCAACLVPWPCSCSCSC